MFPLPPFWAAITVPAGVETRSEARSRPRSLALRRWLWQGRPMQAFWTVAALSSMALNVILIVALILLGRHLFQLKRVVEDQLIGGLAQNFAAMDAAVIRTTVVVDDTIPVRFDLPVSFDLPIEQQTVVRLSQPVTIHNATVQYLQTGGLTITNAPAVITLPEGTELPVHLQMTVPVRVTIPVDTRIPVRLNVPVAIPLRETELHTAFQGLQDVVAPYQALLDQLPDSWREALCGPTRPKVLCWLLVPILEPGGGQ